MNQILVTEKIYVTPELKKKKKAYKIYFIISIIIVVILTSIYIYSEYDRRKSEQVSSEILEEMDKTLVEAQNDKIEIAEEDVLKVLLNGTDEDYLKMEENETTVSDLIENAETEKSPEGYKYKTIATINIPKINVKYPVIQGETGSVKETEALLRISPVKYFGSNPNETGNFCVVGHNYRNKMFFSKVPTLENGDKVELTDLGNRTVTYKVYEIHTVKPDNTEDTTQITGGRKEVTLITCTNDSKKRVIVRCKEIK